MWFYSWGEVSKCLLTSNRKVASNQCKDTTKIQLGEPMSFSWDCLQEYGWVITYRNINDSKTTTLLKAHPSMGNSSQNLATWNSLYNLQAAWLIWDCLAAIFTGHSLLKKEEPTISIWSVLEKSWSFCLLPELRHQSSLQDVIFYLENITSQHLCDHQSWKSLGF